MQPHNRVERKVSWKALETWENICLPESCCGLGGERDGHANGRTQRRVAEHGSRDVRSAENARTFHSIGKRYLTIPQLKTLLNNK